MASFQARAVCCLCCLLSDSARSLLFFSTKGQPRAVGSTSVVRAYVCACHLINFFRSGLRKRGAPTYECPSFRLFLFGEGGGVIRRWYIYDRVNKGFQGWGEGVTLDEKINKSGADSTMKYAVGCVPDRTFHDSLYQVHRFVFAFNGDRSLRGRLMCRLRPRRVCFSHTRFVSIGFRGHHTHLAGVALSLCTAKTLNYKLPSTNLSPNMGFIWQGFSLTLFQPRTDDLYDLYDLFPL